MQHLGKLNLIVPVVQQRLFASLDAQCTSPVRTLAGNTVSGFSIFNITLLGHTLGKHLIFPPAFTTSWTASTSTRAARKM